MKKTIIIEKEPKAPAKTLNVVLLCVGLFIAAFIITMIIIFCVFESVPDTLIQYTLGAGGVEALLCAAIKVIKTIKGDKTEESEELNDV